MATAAPGAGVAAGDDRTGEPARPQPTRIALVAAALALLVWIGFAVYLMTRSGATETEWTRVAWVFASVEAVAFAAAGMLFGSTVNRQRAERAEADADAKRKQAENGRVLAATLKAEEVVHEPAGGTRAPGGPGDDRASEIAARHARLARELFP